VLVALVAGVDGDGGVAEHGFGAGGGDGKELAGGADDGVADFPDFADAFVMDDFEVADGGEAAGAPIDHVAAAVDEAVAVEAKEGFEDGAVESGLEGEALEGPIAGGAEADHLLLDDAAAFGFPLPDAALEFLAAEVLAADALVGEFAFDDELGGDAGVVHAGKPEGVVAAHAVPADEHVYLRVLEHVADVDGAGDVGRREGDGEGAAGTRGRIFGAEEAVFEPGVGPAVLDFLGFVGFGDFAGHGPQSETNFG